MSAQLWWYTARAGGLVAWALATASVVWGLLLSGRITRKPKPAWVLDLHRFLGALTVVFVGRARPRHLARLVRALRARPSSSCRSPRAGSRLRSRGASSRSTCSSRSSSRRCSSAASPAGCGTPST